ncbi:MAG: alpha-2-macroglobulin family protein, partial [Alphaproteobacteria bacterium]|nr:alpha-2-macroglobulin family protein [Alphaproteobacteria bacterium]
WLGRDYSDRTIDVGIEAPTQILPRQTIDVELSLNGIAAGEKAYVTLAAVDVGILQLTNFKTPLPADWYYGKRLLGVGLRDGYGHLIAAAEGGPVTIREGGDEAAADRHLGGLDASSVKTVSLFSGIVAVGDDGFVTVPLEVPDFNGRLRLMAVAWSKSAVGSAETDMTVRDPVVSQVTLPRFLAPGDEAQVSVSVHNVDGPAGKYIVTFEAEGAAGMDGGIMNFQLASDARRNLKWSLSGVGLGVGALTLTIAGPDGLKLVRDWEIAVRPAQTRITKQVSSRVQAGQRQTLAANLLDEFIPGSGEAMVTLSARPELGLAKLLKSLDRYPYGCAEQTTSRALPLLYVAEVAESLGIAENSTVLRGRVQDAIRRIFTMQRSDGSFGMWNAHGNREEWLSAYVMDFLTQAKELKYPVPEYPYQRGLKWLKNSVDAADYRGATLPSRTYALYVLARAGQVRPSDLRYLHDVYLTQIPTALGRAQLGAALALSGDKKRAASAFVSATNSWDRKSRYWD